MSRSARSSLAAAGIAALAISALAACGSASSVTGSSASAGTKQVANKVQVTITDKGCEPDITSVDAGPVTFKIANTGAAGITEAELLSGNRILAEKENIAEGLKGSFSLSLQRGSYTLYCPGGKGAEKVAFTVNAGVAASPTASATGTASTAALAQAGVDYAAYVRLQTATLVTATKTFTDAVRADDIPAAKAAYPTARVFYERIEPVAESFGDLDPAVDARIADVDNDVAAWGGFHRLEYALWQQESLAGMTPIADGLDANILKLNGLVGKLANSPAQIANGATELLDEIGKTKITGEEENYSHIDLVDFVANVAGSEQAFVSLEPALKDLDPALAAAIRQRFAALNTALDTYRTGSAPSDYRNYAAVTPGQRRSLAQLVDALAEPLSQVAGTVVR